MKMRMALGGGTLLGVMLVALALAGCGSGKKEPEVLSNSACMSIADTLKTLKKGDALPRVVQVMGQPEKSYRVIAPFGKTYDVIEYKVGLTSCARLVLNAPNKLELVFDDKGGYVGAGRNVYRRLQSATTVRVKGLPVDERQFEVQ